MSLHVQIRELFSCPITRELMRDPVITECGHTFEKEQLEGWIASQVAEGKDSASCPLDRKPMGKIVPNRVFKQAIEILTRRENEEIKLIDDIRRLPDEDITVVQTAVDNELDRWNLDNEEQISHQLPERQNFVQKVVKAVADYYSCE